MGEGEPSHAPPIIKSLKYGEYQNVVLTEVQYNKLINDFGENKTAEYIKPCDEYVQQTGKKYKDFNLTIRKWITKDGNEAQAAVKGENSSLKDIAEIERMMIERTTKG